MADKADEFTKWPPANPQDLVDELNAAWAAQHGRHGKHWALQVDGNNPISGYRVVMKPTAP
jgi:hypothetical protein